MTTLPRNTQPTHHRSSIIFVAMVALLAVSVGAQWPLGPDVSGAPGATECPPAGYNSVADFDVAAYASAPWYIYKQMPNSYQSAESLYCVAAQYTLLDATTISVRNYANTGAVNGPAMGTSGAANDTFSLLAIIPDATVPSKLKVGPEFIPSFLRPMSYGDYWVVAIGSSKAPMANVSDYDWAVVTAGPPTTVGSMGSCYNGCELMNGCFSSTFSNGEGFWIFTREALPTAEVVDAAEGAAAALGLDMTVLTPVAHQGCMYQGFA